MKRVRNSGFRSTGLLLALAIVSGACAFAGVKPETVTAPPQKYHSLIIGDIVSDKVSIDLKTKFASALRDKLIAMQSFDVVTIAGQGEVHGPIVTLTATITEFDEGSGTLRAFIGFGAGRAKVSGEFKLADERQELGKFAVSRTYAGGLGIGGAGFLSMEDLLNRLAETAADSIAKWARGQSLE